MISELGPENTFTRCVEISQPVLGEGLCCKLGTLKTLRGNHWKLKSFDKIYVEIASDDAGLASNQ